MKGCKSLKNIYISGNDIDFNKAKKEISKYSKAHVIIETI